MAWLLCGSVAVIGSNSLVLGPVAPAVAESLSCTVPAVMTATAAFGLGAAASALLLARHVERVGARRMLHIAFAALAAAFGLSAAAPIVTALVAAQLLAGLASGVALPSIYTLAAVVAPRGREGETIGIVLTGWTISLVAGVSLSAVLADLVHWRAVYVLVGLSAVAVAAAFSLAHGRDTVKSASTPQPIVAIGIPGVGPLLVACGAFMAAFYGTYAYLGDHIHNTLGRPVSANGVAALAYGIGFGGAAFLDRVIDRLGARRALRAALTAVALVYFAFVFAGANYEALLAIVFFWGLFNHFALNALVIRLTAIDPERRGAIMGLNSAVTYLAVFVGTICFGPIHAAGGFAALASAALALTLAATLAAWSRRIPETALGSAVSAPVAAERRCPRSTRPH